MAACVFRIRFLVFSPLTRGLPFFPVSVRACARLAAVQVSSYGRVMSRLRIRSYGYLNLAGYRVVQIVPHGKFFVHRLVARTFIGPPPSSQAAEIHHVDGNKGNNQVNNLEYVTRSQNIMYSWQNNASRRSAGEILGKPVLARCLDKPEWCAYPSVLECSRQLGLHGPNISNVLNGRRKRAGTYTFRWGPAREPDALLGEVWQDARMNHGGPSLRSLLVSSHGRVRNRGIISCGSQNAQGYRTVRVTYDGCRHHLLVHRLVAVAFLGPPPSPQHQDVNHRDRNRSNNRIENVEYVTRAQNVQHSYDTNPNRVSNARALSKPVLARRVGSDHWVWYCSGTRAARELNCARGSISRVCWGKARHTGGYEFKFAEPCVPSILPDEEWRDVVLPEKSPVC